MAMVIRLEASQAQMPFERADFHLRSKVASYPISSARLEPLI
jgi:hypothetical protein